MKPPNVKRSNMSRTQVQKLLSNSDWKRNQIYSQLFAGDTYLHEDGRVLIVYATGRGLLYPERDEFLAFADYMERARKEKPHHILYQHLPSAKNFPDLVPSLINHLAITLSIKRESLDSSLDSLGIIERKVKRRGKENTLNSQLFTDLVAYTGEVVRILVNGKWIMYLSKQEKNVWEPWIIDPSGNITNTWSTLFDMLSEGSPSLGLSSVVRMGVSLRKPAFYFDNVIYLSNDVSGTDIRKD